MRTAPVERAPDINARQIEDLLVQHPHVKDAAVLRYGNDRGEMLLGAYVVADLDRLKLANQTDSRQASDAMVDRWSKLYEVTYSRGPAEPSFVGWNSSYTRQAIPNEEMQEWLQATLERIQALRPRRVLEMGCGVGLLLQHLAPLCVRYVGTDISASAISHLREWLGRRGDLKHVELLKRAATHLQDLTAGSFDTVVLNSVVQYFPDVQYLLSTLEEGTRLLEPGGRIFLGDVKNLRLLPTFYSAVQLGKASDSMSVGELTRRIAQAATQETELAIDPDFFATLPGRLSGISGAEVQLRRGHAPNEMVRYRYDVVLHTAEETPSRTVGESIRWQSGNGFLQTIEAALKDRHWHSFRLCAVPNLRLARDSAARRLIEASDRTSTVQALRRELDRLELDGADPETFWRWGDSYGYAVSVGWDLQASPESFEVRFLDREKQHPVRTPASGPARPWTEYANDPLENRIARDLIVKLREYLAPLLPEGALPSEWTLVRQLPRGPGGDVDRAAL